MGLPRPLIVALSVGVLLTGCASRRPDLDAARREVAAADSAWAAAAAGQNLEASVNSMAEDGVMLPPDQAPVVGRDAIRKYMAASLAIPGFSVQWEPGEIHVASSGDLAYSYGRSRYTFPDSGGALRTVHAKGITVWRLEPDGKWRCVMDIWNGAPEEAPR